MQFKDTTTKTGLIEHAEVKLFGDNGYGQISGNTNRLYQFTNLFNRALDRFAVLALTADGTWQWHDYNYSDLPFASTDIVSGQQDYTLNSTHLEIEKVLIKDTSGLWVTLPPSNELTDTTILENNTGNSGTPDRYAKIGSSLLLNAVPNYNSTAGLKVVFKRGPSYFEFDDTTKEPGIPSIFHPYVYRYACLEYAKDKSMPLAQTLEIDVLKDEAAILEHFNKRAKDEQKQFRSYITSSR